MTQQLDVIEAAAEPATVGRRVSGFIGDAALGALAATPLVLGTATLAGDLTDGYADHPATAVAVTALGALLCVAFAVLQWALLARTGATLGRRMAGYRLVGETSREAPGWGPAFVHHLLTTMVVALTLGIGAIVLAVLASTDPERRTFVDRSARLRTVVPRRRGHAVGAAVVAVAGCAVVAAAAVLPVVVLADPLGDGGVTEGADDDGYYASDVVEDESPSPAVTPAPVDVQPSDDPVQPTGSSDDPLGVGLPFQNQSCTGEYVVLLRSSADPATYAAELQLAQSEASDARYLRTDESCSGFYQDIGGQPIYAGYLGPYSTVEQACDEKSVRVLDDSFVIELSPDRETSRQEC